MSEPELVVSIVTPAFNAGKFLEETIQSVLGQNYPHIDYIVVDGGSTDNTPEILRKYAGRLRYVSEPDRGQSDAVNKGFRMARGEVFAFLNADDTYLPGAVATAVAHLTANLHVGAVYGDAYYVREDGSVHKPYPTQDYDYELLGSLCYICQPASFLWSRVFREAGGLDVDLHLTLDYDLWLRVAERYPMKRIPTFLATSRMHAENKTLSRRDTSFREIVKILRKHRGYVPLNWLYGYAGYKLDRKDDFYSPSLPSLRKYALTVAMGAWYNRTRFPRFLKECFHGTGLAAEMLWKRWSGKLGA